MKTFATIFALGFILSNSSALAKEEMRDCSSKSATSLWKKTNPNQASTKIKPHGQKTQTVSGKVSGVR